MPAIQWPGKERGGRHPRRVWALPGGRLGLRCGGPLATWKVQLHVCAKSCPRYHLILAVSARQKCEGSSELSARRRALEPGGFRRRTTPSILIGLSVLLLGRLRARVRP